MCCLCMWVIAVSSTTGVIVIGNTVYKNIPTTHGLTEGKYTIFIYQIVTVIQP